MTERMTMADRGSLESAERRLFDAELLEVLGGSVEGFVDDDEVAGEASTTTRPAPRRRWVEAALLLLGVVVTVAIVQLRRADATATPQEPVSLDPPLHLMRLIATSADAVPPTSTGLVYRWHAEHSLDDLLPCRQLRDLRLAIEDHRSIAADALPAACLEPLAQLPQLEVLDLQLTAALDSRRLRALRSMPTLRFLTLRLGRALTDGDVAVLRELEQMIWLRLIGEDGRTGVDARVLRELAAVPALQSLTLHSLRGCDEAVLRALRGCHQLRRLELVAMGPQPAAERLGAPLAAGSSGLTVSVAEALRDLPLLDELRLDGVAVSAAAIRALPARLTGLKLTQAPDAGAEVYDAIAAMPHLRRLHLGTAKPWTAFLHPRSEIPTAADAERAGMPPQAPIAASVAKLLARGSLTEFAHDFRMPDAIRAALPRASGLTRIQLRLASADDVAAAARAPDLTHLLLSSCSFDVAPLQGAKALRELCVDRLGMSMDRLRGQLPGVRVTSPY